MPLNDELLPASFRGVSFLVDISTLVGGRKTVTHEFVGSDKRSVEDLGLLNKTITFSAVISGSDYVRRRSQLLAALEEPGPGDLILPIDGILSVVSKPYTLIEVSTELGEAKFELTFQVSQVPIFPQETGADVSTTSNSVDASLNRAEASFGEKFVATSGDNLLAAAETINNLLKLFDDVTKEFVKDDEFINDFFADFIVFKESVFSLVQKPEALSNQIRVLFSRLEDVAAAVPDKSISIFEFFYNFGDDEPQLDIETFELIQRRRNDDLINQYTQTEALLINYRNLSNLSFLTTGEIELQKENIESQFIKVTQNTILNDNDQEEINNTRNLIMQLLEDQSSNVFKLIDADINVIPATVLAYRYYGNLDNTQNLIDINAIKDPSFVEGQISILGQ